MAWPPAPATYDVISRNRSKRFAPNFGQNVYATENTVYTTENSVAYSYWKWQVLMKNHIRKIQEKPYGGWQPPSLPHPLYVRG